MRSMTENKSLTGASPAVWFRQTEKEFSAFCLGPLDLRILDGSLTALRGPNGSGKTTLLRLAAGLTSATAGTVLIRGAAAGSLPARRHVSYCPDQGVFYDDISVGEHVEFICALHGLDPASERVRGVVSALALTKLTDQRPVSLSRGWQQRVALALAFIRPFSVLLLDEPFANLDEDGRNVLTELLRAQVPAKTVCIATHDTRGLPEITQWVDLHDGTLNYSEKD